MEALHSLQVGGVPQKLRPGTLCGASHRANEGEVDEALILGGCHAIHLMSTDGHKPCTSWHGWVGRVCIPWIGNMGPVTRPAPVSRMCSSAILQTSRSVSSAYDLQYLWEGSAATPRTLCMCTNRTVLSLSSRRARNSFELFCQLSAPISRGHTAD